MILVTKIEYKEVPGDRAETPKLLGMPELTQFNEILTPQGERVSQEVLREAISGQRFAMVDEFGDKKEICLGYSEDIGEILGMPLKSFESLREQLDAELNTNSALRIERTGLCRRIDNANSFNLWQRLKFLFKRVTV